MFQPDLFSLEKRADAAVANKDHILDVPAILARLTTVCERPRYNFMVLNLIAQAGGETGSAGPYVREGNRRIPVRDWLCDAMVPVAQRDPRRLAITEKVRKELEAKQALPVDPAAAEQLVEAQVCKRVRQSGHTNISRAVSELVRAGLVRRHYQGYRVDHANRGAQRQAVYTITEETRQALRSRSR